jgi:hypothetical protein
MKKSKKSNAAPGAANSPDRSAHIEPRRRAIRMMAAALQDHLAVHESADAAVLSACRDLLNTLPPYENALPWHQLRRKGRTDLEAAIDSEISNRQSPVRLCCRTACFLTGFTATRLREYVQAGRLREDVRDDGLFGYAPDELERLLRELYRGDARECQSLLFEPKHDAWRAAQDIGMPSVVMKALLKRRAIFAIHGKLLECDVHQLGRFWARYQMGFLPLLVGMKPGRNHAA